MIEIKENQLVSKNDKKSESHEGGCLCGKVRYKTIGQPKIVGACHCRYCQLRSGSAFGVLVYFKEAFLSLEKGVVAKYQFRSESNFQWENQFCRDCGTTVFFRLEVFKGLVGVAGGTFDPPAFWYDIGAEVFTRDKADFVACIKAKAHFSTFHYYNPKNLESPRLKGEK